MRTRMYKISAILLSITLFACGGGESNSTTFTVSNFAPANGKSDVKPDSKIQVTFTDSVDKTSLNAYTFQVMESEGMSLIEGKITYQESSKTVTFEPYMPIPYATPIHVMVTTMIRNAAGTHLEEPKNIYFETLASPLDTTFHPDDGLTGVSPRSTIRIQFGEGVNMFTVSDTTVTLAETATGNAVDALVEMDEDSQTAIVWVEETYNGGNGLKPSSSYTYTVNTGVKDMDGNSFFNADQVKSFTTAASTPFTNIVATDWDEYADAIGIADDGTLIVAGETWGALTDAVEHYDGDGFVAAIDPDNGDILDLVQFGSGADTNWNLSIADPVYDMAMIGNDIYMTGFTRGTLEAGNTVAGDRKLFVAKYSWNGTQLNRAVAPVLVSASSDIEGYAMTSSSDHGAVYVVGTVKGGITGETAMGQDDIVVAKFNTDLSSAWVKQYGTAARDIGRGIAVSGNAVYVTGDTLGDFSNPDNPHVALNPFVLRLNEATGARSDVSFNTSNAVANPTSAHDRMVTGMTVSGSDIYVLGTQVDADGISTFALQYTTTGGNPSYHVFGDTTENEDEVATGIYTAPNGNVYAAVTRFHEMNMGSGMEIHGMSQIMNLSSTGFSLYKSINAAMHASVRSMVMDASNNMYVTGYVHGAMDGVMPVGMGDAFIAQP